MNGSTEYYYFQGLLSHEKKITLARLACLCLYLQMVPHMHVPASITKYVSSSLWPRLMFCELKITNILKSSEWVLQKGELLWEPNFL